MAVDMSKPNWNANMTTYVSQVFQADWNSAPVSMAYNVYIRDHYVHDLNPSADLSPRCSAQSPAMQTMQHQTAMISNKRKIWFDSSRRKWACSRSANNFSPTPGPRRCG